jgi:hypothetical protein
MEFLLSCHSSEATFGRKISLGRPVVGGSLNFDCPWMELLSQEDEATHEDSHRCRQLNLQLKYVISSEDVGAELVISRPREGQCPPSVFFACFDTTLELTAGPRTAVNW